MSPTLKNTLLHGKNNIIYVIIFSSIFAFLGSFIPNIYYNYFSNKQYVEIYNPLIEYRPCRINSDTYLYILNIQTYPIFGLRNLVITPYTPLIKK